MPGSEFIVQADTIIVIQNDRLLSVLDKNVSMVNAFRVCDDLLRQGVLVGLSATTSHGQRPGENKARALLEAFRDRADDILRFVDDLSVPPTSNDAERGLRPSKIQQKISGRLTSIARTKDRYRVLGYLTTAAKHGLDRFTVLLDAFRGHVWLPGPAAVT